MYFIIVESNKKLRCFQLDTSTWEYSFKDGEETKMNKNLFNQTLIHFFCFIALTLAKILEVTNIDNHISSILNIVTVPLYQFSVFQSTQYIKQTNMQINQGCYSNQMGDVKFWMFIEVSLFYVNLFVLFLYLIGFKVSSDTIKREKSHK